MLTQHNLSLDYGIEAKLDLPVINVGNSGKPVYLPPEVCVVLPGQPAGVKLSANQTREMIKRAVVMPHLNAAYITSSGVGTVGFFTGGAQTLVCSLAMLSPQFPFALFDFRLFRHVELTIPTSLHLDCQ